MMYRDMCPHGVPFRWPETCDDCECDETPEEISSTDRTVRP